MDEEVARQLMNELKEQRESHKAQLEQNKAQMELLINKIAELRVPGAEPEGDGGHVPPRLVRSAEQILLDKQQSVFANLMKCTDLKNYKLLYRRVSASGLEPLIPK